MVQARKSHITNEEKTKSKGGPPEYPYVIYCSYHREGEEYPRVLVLKYEMEKQARNLVDQVIAGDEWEWQIWQKTDAMIVTAKGVKIRAIRDQLRSIMEIDPQTVTRESIKDVLQFKYGKSEHPRIENTEETKSEEPTERISAPKLEKPIKEKTDTSQLVSANDIAKKLKVEGRIVRAVLRSLKLSKPAHGWAWSKTEASSIEEKVSAAIQRDKKAKK